MPDRDLIAEGRQKVAAATPGPWEGDSTEIYRANAYDERTGLRVWVAETCDIDDTALSDANTDLIVWARNNLPALLDGLEAVERERDEAHMELSDLRIETETNYVAIAARQQRDRERIAKALKLIDKWDEWSGYDLAGEVRAMLEGKDA
jgi:hypothetical protein